MTSAMPLHKPDEWFDTKAAVFEFDIAFPGGPSVALRGGIVGESFDLNFFAGDTLLKSMSFNLRTLDSDPKLKIDNLDKNFVLCARLNADQVTQVLWQKLALQLTLANRKTDPTLVAELILRGEKRNTYITETELKLSLLNATLRHQTIDGQTRAGQKARAQADAQINVWI